MGLLKDISDKISDMREEFRESTTRFYLGLVNANDLATRTKEEDDSIIGYKLNYQNGKFDIEYEYDSEDAKEEHECDNCSVVGELRKSCLKEIELRKTIRDELATTRESNEKLKNLLIEKNAKISMLVEFNNQKDARIAELQNELDYKEREIRRYAKLIKDNGLNKFNTKYRNKYTKGDIG